MNLKMGGGGRVLLLHKWKCKYLQADAIRTGKKINKKIAKESCLTHRSNLLWRDYRPTLSNNGWWIGCIEILIKGGRGGTHTHTQNHSLYHCNALRYTDIFTVETKSNVIHNRNNHSPPPPPAPRATEVNTCANFWWRTSLVSSGVPSHKLLRSTRHLFIHFSQSLASDFPEIPLPNIDCSRQKRWHNRLINPPTEEETSQRSLHDFPELDVQLGSFNVIIKNNIFQPPLSNSVVHHLKLCTTRLPQRKAAVTGDPQGGQLYMADIHFNVAQIGNLWGSDEQHLKRPWALYFERVDSFLSFSVSFNIAHSTLAVSSTETLWIKANICQHREKQQSAASLYDNRNSTKWNRTYQIFLFFISYLIIPASAQSYRDRTLILRTWLLMYFNHLWF